LALLVHNDNFFKDSLPTDHPIYQSRYWKDQWNIKLKKYLQPPDEPKCEVSGMSATGVTPSVIAYSLHYKQLTKNEALLQEILELTTSAQQSRSSGNPFVTAHKLNSRLNKSNSTLQI
jgi:hypothetical protein